MCWLYTYIPIFFTPRACEGTDRIHFLYVKMSFLYHQYSDSYLVQIQSIMNKAKTSQNVPEEPTDNQDPMPQEPSTLESLDQLKKDLEKCNDLDTKLQVAMEIMEASLAQKGNMSFKNFWESRKLCLELFKENISPGLRSMMWSKFSELTKEARRLKQILDEQSAFIIEQIDIAIKALEKDIAKVDQQLPEIEKPQVVKDNSKQYQTIQKELNLLNAQAARINALRKELVKTAMRLRNKNGFFQRLSECGGKVFPRRKELIKQVSDFFVQDVETFMKKHFTEINPKEQLFRLRDEIKALQAIAKTLTLNTYSFTHTRTKLSECWEKLKALDKERKKVREEHKQKYRKNVEKMKIVEKLKNEEKKRKEEALEKIKSAIQELEKSITKESVEKLNEDKDKLIQMIEQTDLIESEKQAFNEVIDSITDAIAEKSEQKIIETSEDKKQLKQILKQKVARRTKIKEGLENYRKSSGGSGLDFEQSMHYNDLIQRDKDRLDEMDQKIQELETKLER